MAAFTSKYPRYSAGYVRERSEWAARVAAESSGARGDEGSQTPVTEHHTVMRQEGKPVVKRPPRKES